MAEMIETIEELSPEFLTQIFQNQLDDAAIQVLCINVSLLTLKTAHTACLHRLEISYVDENHKGPASAIAKLPQNPHEINPIRELFQPGTKEMWFYRNVAGTGSIRTPQLYFGQASRETGVAALLLEDLGHLEAVTQVDGVPEKDIYLALAEIGRLHAMGWGATNTTAFDALRELTGDPEKNEAQVQKFLVDAWPLFVSNSRFHIPHPVRELGDALAKYGMPMKARDLQGPATLLHGDYRVDNMLFRETAGVRECIVLDWEDVSIGCGLIDVAWLIVGCVPNLTSETEQAMLRYYFDGLINRGVSNYSFASCFADYRKCLIERFVQGVLSGTIYEPGSASEADVRFATTIGARFVTAADRLGLHELL